MWYQLLATDLIAIVAFGKSFKSLESGKVRTYPVVRLGLSSLS
jgi:hypothetical protein